MTPFEYPDAEALDYGLTYGQSGPGRDQCYDNFADAAYRARDAFPNKLDLRYGKGDRQRLDFFYTPHNPESAPTVLFFHGGGWRLSDKFYANFYAEAYCPNGINFAACTYGFSPLFTVGEIIGHAKLAVTWIHEHAATLKIDPTNLFISGNSAGAHLAACALIEDWEGRGWPSGSVRGGIGFSGMYDVLAVFHSTVYQSLKLTEEDAHAWSPLYHVPKNCPPFLIFYGEKETEEFKRQSHAMADAWQAAGNTAEVYGIDEGDHFSSQWIARTPATESYERIMAFIKALGG